MEKANFHNKIEEVLGSIDHIQRAEANPFLFTRVMEKLKQPAPGILKPMVIWQVATSMVIVLGLNIGIGLYAFSKKNISTTPAESAYFNNHIYNY